MQEIRTYRILTSDAYYGRMMRIVPFMVLTVHLFSLANDADYFYVRILLRLLKLWEWQPF